VLLFGSLAGFAAAPAEAQSLVQAAAPDSPDSAATAPPTLPNSNVVDVEKNAGSTKTRPAFRLLPQFVPGSEDWSRPYADWLDSGYNQWLAAKKDVSERFKLDFGIDYSFYPQWGTKGTPVYANVYYPYVTWKPFKDTQFGSGEINIVTSHQAYFSTQNTSSQATSAKRVEESPQKETPPIVARARNTSRRFNRAIMGTVRAKAVPGAAPRQLAFRSPFQPLRRIRLRLEGSF
jgi:hypothetical protein